MHSVTTHATAFDGATARVGLDDSALEAVSGTKDSGTLFHHVSGCGIISFTQGLVPQEPLTHVIPFWRIVSCCTGEYRWPAPHDQIALCTEHLGGLGQWRLFNFVRRSNASTIRPEGKCGLRISIRGELQGMGI